MQEKNARKNEGPRPGEIVAFLNEIILPTL